MGAEQGVSAASGALAGAKAGSVFGPWGTVIGGVIGGAAGLLGSSQKAPTPVAYKPVDLQAVQRQTIAGNLANFGDASLLASKTNTFQQSEAQRLLEQAIPGYGKLQARLLQQVNDDLDHQTSLPQDVQDKIARYAAEKGVSHGTSGQFNGFSLVKDFGFNLVDWQNAQRASALKTLQAISGIAPRVNVMSPMSMMVNPSTAIDLAQSDARLQYAAATGQAAAADAAAASNRSQVAGLIQAGLQVGSAAYTQSIQPKAVSAPPTYLARTGPT